MCGPAVAWDWLMLDLAYVLVLVGGAMTLRAKGSVLSTWVWFGLLSAAVGAFLFTVTWMAVPAAASAPASQGSLAMLDGC